MLYLQDGFSFNPPLHNYDINVDMILKLKFIIAHISSVRKFANIWKILEGSLLKDSILIKRNEIVICRDVDGPRVK